MTSFLKPMARAIIPGSVRVGLRRAFHSDWVYRRSLKHFKRNLEQSVESSESLLQDLRYGWGNQGFSASEEYLAACISSAMSCSGTILECGSGLSTLLVGMVSERTGNPHFVLEHSSNWAEKIRKSLLRNGVRQTQVLSCALHDYGEYEWYHNANLSLPDDIALVICDGPPGTTKGGRYGLMPSVAKKLSGGCTVLLDDTARVEEREIAERWVTEYGCSMIERGTRAPFMEITIP